MSAVFVEKRDVGESVAMSSAVRESRTDPTPYRLVPCLSERWPRRITASWSTCRWARVRVSAASPARWTPGRSPGARAALNMAASAAGSLPRVVQLPSGSANGSGVAVAFAFFTRWLSQSRRSSGVRCPAWDSASLYSSSLPADALSLRSRRAASMIRSVSAERCFALSRASFCWRRRRDRSAGGGAYRLSPARSLLSASLRDSPSSRSRKSDLRVEPAR